MTLWSRFKKHQEGATAIEFAIVSFAFFMLLFAVIEFGLFMFTNIAIEAATVQVARSASLGTVTTAGCADRVCEVKTLIEKKTYGLINSGSVFVNATVVSDPTTSAPPIPDICTSPSPTTINQPVPQAQCRMWEENNGITGYQESTELDAGAIGDAGDLVEIRVSYLWHILFPIFRSYFGDNGVITISSSTVIKNEPFDDPE